MFQPIWKIWVRNGNLSSSSNFRGENSKIFEFCHHLVFEMSSARATRPWKQMMGGCILFTTNKGGDTLQKTNISRIPFWHFWRWFSFFSKVGYISSRDGISFGNLGGRYWTTTAYHFCYFFVRKAPTTSPNESSIWPLAVPKILIFRACVVKKPGSAYACRCIYI